MNPVTNTMDNDTASEQMRVSLIRYHLAYMSVPLTQITLS